MLDVNLSAYYPIAGQARDIIGASYAAREQWRTSFLADFFPETARLPVLTNRMSVPDVEALLTANPNIVVAAGGLGGSLEPFGFRELVELRPDAVHSERSKLAIWRKLGALAGRPQQTEALLETFYVRARANAVRGREAGPLKPTRVAVIFVVGDLWRVGGRNFFLNDALTAATGQNVSAGAATYPIVNAESLLLLDPDVLLLNSAPEDHHFPEEFYAAPEWQALRAVRERRVYKIPALAYLRGPVEEPLLIRWFVEVFHPGAMEPELRQMVRATYANLYHYEMRDDEIDALIFLRQNLGSADYARFA
ncbi:MAG TPA: ABC transporter substrate-binding protein [Steroidobacteraceae bacterium]